MQRSSSPPGPKTSCMHTFASAKAAGEFRVSLEGAAPESASTPIESSSKGTYKRSAATAEVAADSALAVPAWASRRSRRFGIVVSRLGKFRPAHLYERTVCRSLHDSTGKERAAAGGNQAESKHDWRELGSHRQFGS